MSHLVGRAPQKATIIARGSALGYVFHLSEEERYLETKEELLDWIVVALAGRAAEQVVFGRVTNGAANDLEKVTEIARSMVFEWGMGDSAASRTLRADNYALSEETKRHARPRAGPPHRHAYEEALRILTSTARARPRRGRAAREGDAVARRAARALRRRRAGVARLRERRRRAGARRRARLCA